jgi:heme exporter protein D
MIAMDASGRVVGYGTVGWLAIAASLIAIAMVGQIAMHTGKRNS